MKNENEITVKDLTALPEKMKKRLSVSNHSEQTIVNYLRAVEYLCKYTGKTPQETEIDEVTDYLYQLQYFKFRIRINRSKGNRDRYTVLSKVLLPQLREYYKNYQPQVYLFNGSSRGKPMTASGLRHALKMAVKKAGIKKINLHILRHCFASHALEDGMNIRTLQEILGHQSLKTTMIYLHVSEVPLLKGFSPFDNWEEKP